MTKKSKGVFLDPTSSHSIGVCEDAKARLRHQTLLQDYVELQKEADGMRGRLDAAKQRKVILAAEVGFLRRRYKYLMRTKSMNSSQEPSLVQMPNLLSQPKTAKEQQSVRKEANKRRVSLVSEPTSKKKHHIIKQVAQRDDSPLADQSRKKTSYGVKEAKGHGLTFIPPVSDLNPKGILHIRKDTLAPILDRNQKERTIGANDINMRNSAVTIDLNQDSTPSGQETPLPSRAPIFDLNEISTGDEDFQGNEATKYEEAKKSLIRSINISEEQQGDLKLSICRNAGESSSRPGKRKISWQDPVALRV